MNDLAGGLSHLQGAGEPYLSFYSKGSVATHLAGLELSTSAIPSPNLPVASHLSTCSRAQSSGSSQLRTVSWGQYKGLLAGGFWKESACCEKLKGASADFLLFETLGRFHALSSIAGPTAFYPDPPDFLKAVTPAAAVRALSFATGVGHYASLYLAAGGSPELVSSAQAGSLAVLSALSLPVIDPAEAEQRKITARAFLLATDANYPSGKHMVPLAPSSKNWLPVLPASHAWGPPQPINEAYQLFLSHLRDGLEARPAAAQARLSVSYEDFDLTSLEQLSDSLTVDDLISSSKDESLSASLHELWAGQVSAWLDEYFDELLAAWNELATTDELAGGVIVSYKPEDFLGTQISGAYQEVASFPHSFKADTVFVTLPASITEALVTHNKEIMGKFKVEAVDGLPRAALKTLDWKPRAYDSFSNSETRGALVRRAAHTRMTFS